MKNIYLIGLLLLLVFIENTANAQRTLFGAGGGFATFNMSDLKDYNKSVQNNLPFNPVLTDDFPGWLNFNGDILFSLPKLMAIGLTVSTTSTGSRLHMSDYSGEYSFNNRQHGWFPGIKVLAGKAPGRQDGLCATMEGGMAFSSMSFDEKILAYEEEINDSREFSARGFFVKPGIAYMHQFGTQFIFSANVSYYIGFESGYYIKGKSDQKITNTDTGKNIKPNWNGLRAGITLYWIYDYLEE